MVSEFLYARVSAGWRYLVRRVGPEGLLTLGLLGLALWAVCAGLAGLLGVLESFRGLLFGLVLAGLILGWRYGLRKRASAWAAAWLLSGLPVIFLFTGRLWGDFGRLVSAASLRMLAWYAHDFLGGISYPAGEAAGFGLAWSEFTNTAALFADDLHTWLQGLAAGQPAFRSGAVIFMIAGLVWSFSLWAGAVTRRTRKPLAALAPAGALLAALLAYTRSTHPFPLVAFIFLLLLLMAVQAHGGNIRRWAERRMDYPEDIRIDFGISATVFVTGIVLVAYAVPYFNFRGVIRDLLWLDRPAVSSNSELGEALGLPPPTEPPSYFSFLAAPGMPRQHLVGMPPEEREQVVLTIGIIGQGLPEGQAYYWRSLTYDVYTGSGWSTGPTNPVRYEAGTELPLEDLPYVRPVRQAVTAAPSLGELAYISGDVRSMDQDFEVAWHPPVGGGVFDVFGVRRSSPTYTVDGLIPLRLEAPLLAAGTDYPSWVRFRYLALPDEIPARVLDLAASLTRDAATPYEKALAIEAYLRTFPYTLQVPPPTPGRDLVDAFLFDLRRGYCDYYASAMVVMARAVGLPARLAVGYAQGDFDPNRGQYFVRAMDAHSWPEIYFPGFGWVPFEPTAGQAELVPFSGEVPAALPALPGLQGGGQAGRWTWLSWLGWAGLAVFFGLVLGNVWTYLRLMRLGPVRFFAAVFQNLYAYAHGLDLQLPARATPLELTAGLGTHYPADLQRFRWAVGQLDALTELTQGHLQASYGPHAPSETAARAALRRWIRLDIALKVLRIAERLKLLR